MLMTDKFDTIWPLCTNEKLFNGTLKHLEAPVLCELQAVTAAPHNQVTIEL